MYLTYQNLVVRDATLEDSEILVHWWNDGKVMAHAGFPLGLETTKEEVASQILERPGRLIIELEHQPIGEMSYRRIEKDVAEIGIKICDFSRQEKGIGKIVLSMLIQELFDLGFEKIVLDTNLNNLRAQHVYERLGFQKIRVNIDAWKDQLGNLQSSQDYALTKQDFNSFIS